MIFKSVEIENFMAIKAAKFTLDNVGLVLIQGDNEDDTSQSSNGAGKSTMVDALCWCLYGETARGITGDDIINRVAKKGTRVSVDIELVGQTYRVSRHRKHKLNKNRLTLEQIDGATVTDHTKGTDRLTQDAIEKLLGCSKKVFQSSVYIGQENLPDLPNMTDRPLKELIEEAAGTDSLAKAFEVANNRRKIAEGEFEVVSRNLSSLNTQIDYAKTDLESVSLKNANWAKQIEAEVEGHKIVARQKADRARKLSEFLDNTDRNQYEVDIKAIDDKLNGLRAEGAEETRLSQIVSTTAAELRHATQNLEAEILKAKRIRAELDTVSSKIGSPCNECGKTYQAEDMEDARAATEKRLREQVDKVRTMQDAPVKAKEAHEQAQSALSAYQKTKTDPSSLVAAKNELAQRLREYDTIASEKATAVTEAQHYVSLAKSAAERPNPYVELLKDRQASLSKLEAEQADLQAQLKEKGGRVELLKEACQVYGAAGVRAHILDTVTPYLNARTAHYLGTLSDGNIEAMWSTLSTTKSGEVREKFKIDVVKPTGAATFKGLSGGEKRKARLACALALQDLVASRASKPIALWIGDEIDDAIDPAGLERLMSVLEEKARERGSVLVISHNELRDWIRETVIVKHKGGESTLHGTIAA